MVIAVDFDGTIVEHEYPKIGKPIPFAVETLKQLREDGHTLILWTVREGRLLQEAIDYCKNHGVTFYAHNKNYPEEEMDENTPRKLTSEIFIDDRNIGGLPDWGIIYRIIKSGNNRFDSAILMETDRPRRKKNWFIRVGEAWEKSRGYRY